MSEFGGLWKHQNIPTSGACTKSVTVNLQNVDCMEEEKLIVSHTQSYIYIYNQALFNILFNNLLLFLL